jgi:hypothetical protein
VSRSQRRLAPLLALILLGAPVPSPTAAATTLPSPVAHWAFDETSGSTLIDQSGHGRDGSFSGQVTRIDDGVFGRALRLHSTSTSVTAAAVGLSETYPTVSFWVRADDVPTSGAVLFEKGARACGEPTMGVYVDGTGLEIRLMSYGGHLASARLQLDLGLWDGEWHHIAFTKGVSQVIRLYVDHLSWGMANGSVIIDYSHETVHDLSFGSPVMGAPCDLPTFVGDLDDIRIYDRDLNQNQIGALAPPIPTATTLTTRSNAVVLDMRCWTANVAPPPPSGYGDLRVYELFADGREGEIGHASSDWCAHYHGSTLQPGAYHVPLQFHSKGIHRIRATFIPGDPWQASTSAWVDQAVAGLSTTTWIETDAVGAGQPIEVRVTVGGDTHSVSGDVALYDVTGGSVDLIATQPVTRAGSAGRVTFMLAGRAAGTYELEARYQGDSIYDPSSAVEALVVGTAEPTPTATPTPTPTPTPTATATPTPTPTPTATPTTTPMPDSVPPAGSIAAVGAFTNSTSIAVDVPATDTSSEVTHVALSNDATTWSTRSYAPAQAWTLPPTDGTRTVYAKWRDAAGNWSAVASDTIVLDTTPPTATAPTHRLVGGSAISSGRTTVRLAWTGADATSGVARNELAQSTDGGAWSTVSSALGTATIDRPLAPSHTYRFRVRAVDRAGNTGAWMSGPTFRLTAYSELNGGIRYTGTWTTSSSTVYWGGRVRFSSRAGARATITVTGRSVEWVARKGPTRGRAQVYVNGVLTATVDLYASTYQNQRVAWAATWSTSATRTISIRVLGTSGRPRVDVDAFVVGS